MKTRLPYHNRKPTEISVNAPTEEARAEFGRRLYAAMLKKGWTQSELARQAELHANGKRLGRDNVSYYVRGKVMAGPLHLQALAKALDVEPDDLIPTRGVPSSESNHPAFDMRDLGDNRVWLRVNQALTWDAAVAIMKILKEGK